MGYEMNYKERVAVMTGAMRAAGASISRSMHPGLGEHLIDVAERFGLRDNELTLVRRQPDMPDQHAEPEDETEQYRRDIQQPPENPAD
jgi:hypothetical protein